MKLRLIDPADPSAMPPDNVVGADPASSDHEADAMAPAPDVDRDTLATRGVMSQALIAALIDRAG
jgi:hypothetical protein